MKLTKPLLILGIILTSYGILCRLAGIYFFWDSRIFGFFILLLSLLSYLFGLYRRRKLESKKTIWVKVGIAFLTVLLIGTPAMLAFMMNSNAYKAAVSQLKTNPQIQQDLGKIKGLGLLRSGSISTTSTGDATSGEAQFSFTINGEKKYVDVTVNLIKGSETDWQIVSIK